MALTPKEEVKRSSFSDYVGSDQEESRGSPKASSSEDKRLRREIANSNERRRMQSINSGFQLLRSLIPRCEGEKLSKAGILQHAADYIRVLQSEKTKLLAQTQQLKRYVLSLEKSDHSDSSTSSQSPPPKRRKRDTESSDEGIGLQFEDSAAIEDLRREMADIRRQLEEERGMRTIVEEERVVKTAVEEEEEEKTVPDTEQSAPVTSASAGHVMEVSRLGIQRASETQLAPIPAATVQPSCTPSVNMQPPKKRYIESMPKTAPPTTAVEPPPALATPRIRDQPSSMSRRNLETIVEAIRHLEGDQLFGHKRPEQLMDDSSSGSMSPCYHRDLSPITAATTLCPGEVVYGIPTSGMVQVFRPAYAPEHCLRRPIQATMSS